MPYAGQVFIAMKREYIDLKPLYSCNSVFSLCLLWADRKYILFMFSFSKVLTAVVREPQASKKGLLFLLFPFHLKKKKKQLFLDNKVAIKQSVFAWTKISETLPCRRKSQKLRLQMGSPIYYSAEQIQLAIRALSSSTVSPPPLTRPFHPGIQSSNSNGALAFYQLPSIFHCTNPSYVFLESSSIISKLAQPLYYLYSGSWSAK